MKKMQFNLKKQIIIFTLICIIVSFIVSSFYNNSYAETVHGQMIAESGHDENGAYHGGTPGDQTGNEALIRPFYNYPWNCYYRYKPDDNSVEANNVRQTIAQMACNGANNPHIGYAMDTKDRPVNALRTGCWTQVKTISSHDLADIDVDVNTDCSAFVASCIVATGYICNISELQSYSPVPTGSMPSELSRCGFSQISGNLQEGDILLNITSHTAIYVGDATASAGNSSIRLTTEQINDYYNNAEDLDTSNFEYNGYPRDISIVQKKAPIDIIDAIKNIANYILGVLVSGIRMAIVGFAEAIEKSINNLLLKIEGTEPTKDQAEYSIEDLLYNRIPALDVNIFSSTPGGKKLNEDSVLATIRKLVAGWYYSVRNIAAIVLFIILLYTGLKMAISVSAEKKADYSKRLVTWLKCMVLIFIIHYIIIFILNINDLTVSLFAKTVSKANSLHDTIEARAYDVRFTVGITGMIMYVTLIVYWVRFLFLYFRRYIYNIIYIVLASFAIVRYAIDNSNAKGKSGFERWLNKFVSNIIIQPAHALAYTLFMGIATDIALESIGGFIIALVFMSQILKMDEYVLGIIKFNGNNASEHLRKMKKPMKEDLPIQLYGYAKLYGTAARNIGAIGTSIARPIANNIKYGNYDKPKKANVISRALNKLDQNRISKTIDDINSKRMTEDERLREPELAEERDREIAKLERKNENRKLKIDARNHNPEAKRILKLKRNNNKQIFTASAGAVKNALGTITGATMAIPLAVAASPEAGIAAAKMISSPSKHIKNYKNIKKKQEKIDEKKENIEQTIILVNQSREIIDDMNRTINKIQTSNDDNIEDIKEQLRTVNRINGNSTNIRRIIQNEKAQNEDISLEKSIDRVIKQIDKTDELTQNQKEKLKNKEIDLIKKKNVTNDTETEKTFDYEKQGTIRDIKDEDVKEVSNRFSDDVAREVVSPENFVLAQKINKLKDINEKIKEVNGNKDVQINIEKEINGFGQ